MDSERYLKLERSLQGKDFFGRNTLRCGIKETRGTDKSLSWKTRYASLENTREKKTEL